MSDLGIKTHEEGIWTVIDGDRDAHVQWLVTTTIETFPDIFGEAIPEAKVPDRNPWLSEEYGPDENNRSREQMLWILFGHHGVTQAELDRALAEIRSGQQRMF